MKTFGWRTFNNCLLRGGGGLEEACRFSFAAIQAVTSGDVGSSNSAPAVWQGQPETSELSKAPSPQVSAPVFQSSVSHSQ